MIYNGDTNTFTRFINHHNYYVSVDKQFKKIRQAFVTGNELLDMKIGDGRESRKRGCERGYHYDMLEQ